MTDEMKQIMSQYKMDLERMYDENVAALTIDYIKLTHKIGVTFFLVGILVGIGIGVIVEWIFG